MPGTPPLDPGKPLLPDTVGKGFEDLTGGGQAALIGQGVELHLDLVVFVTVQVPGEGGRLDLVPADVHISLPTLRPT